MSPNPRQHAAPTIVALLDGNVLDYFLDHPDELDATVRAVEEGRVQFLETHILADELPQSDAMRRSELQAVVKLLQAEHIPTTGLVLDVSRLDMASLHDDKQASEYRTFTAGNPRHAEDALLAMTARTFGAILVTCEKKRLPKPG